MVTDLASFTWLRNVKEPTEVVARWMTQLQKLDFKHMHRRGKQHSHANRLQRHASRPCKRDTCLECVPLLHHVTPGENRMVTESDPYLEHFCGYLELVEVDSSFFRDESALVATPEQKPILSE